MNFKINFFIISKITQKMKSILFALLDNPSSNHRIDIKSDFFHLKCDTKGDGIKINLIMTQKFSIDLCNIFDEKLLSLLEEDYSFFEICIETTDSCKIYHQALDCFKINNNFDQCYTIKKNEYDQWKIKLCMHSENKNMDDPKIKLLDFHLKKCVDQSKTNLTVESYDLWIKKLVYDSFIKYKAHKFKCQLLRIYYLKTHYELSILSITDVSFLNENVIHHVHIKDLSENVIEHAIFLRHLNHKIQRLKVSKLKINELHEFDFQHLHYLKSVSIESLRLNDRTKYMFLQKYVAFANKLKISMFQNHDIKESSRLIDIVSKSSLRKFHIENMCNRVPYDDFKKLKQMNHLTSLKLLGSKSDISEYLIELLLDSPRLKVFESDYVISKRVLEKIKSHIVQDKNKSLCKLKISFNSNVEKEKIIEVINHFSNLSNLKIEPGRQDTMFLYGLILSGKKNKLSKIECKKESGVDLILTCISIFNKFKGFMKNESDSVEQYDKNRRIQHPHSSIYDLIDKFDSGETIAHYFAKLNNNNYMNDERLKQLENVPCVKRSWLPSTYLSFHGNPIVKEMFKEKKQSTGLGEIHSDILCNIFEFVAGSIWEESLLYNLPRVNKNFRLTATCYRNRLINQIEKINGIKIIGEDNETSNINHNKLKRTRCYHQENNENQKKRKVSSTIQIKKS